MSSVPCSVLCVYEYAWMRDCVSKQDSTSPQLATILASTSFALPMTSGPTGPPRAHGPDPQKQAGNLIGDRLCATLSFTWITSTGFNVP